MNSSAYKSSDDEDKCTDSEDEILSERDDEGESCIERESCVDQRMCCTYEESVDESASCNERMLMKEKEAVGLT